MAKRTKPVEPVKGRYTAVPHDVLDSVAFMGASHTARSLLFDLMRQHNGSNNGRLQTTTSWLKKRGWMSADTVQNAKQNLIERNLIILTRQGGLNAGASWYALTWLPISNFTGLDILPKNYHPGAWSFMDRVPPIIQRRGCSDSRNSAAPNDGTGDGLPVPSFGTKTAVFCVSAVPSAGNNECLPLPTTRSALPVVGKKGRSGVRGSGRVQSALHRIDPGCK